MRLRSGVLLPCPGESIWGASRRRKKSAQPSGEGFPQIARASSLHAIVLAPMATKSKKKRSTKKKPAPAKLKAAKSAKRAKSAKGAHAAGTDPKHVAAILTKVDEAYPDPTCELDHENAFQ